LRNEAAFADSAPYPISDPVKAFAYRYSYLEFDPSALNPFFSSVLNPIFPKMEQEKRSSPR
jgi:hypothetical protein